jgi:selenocysteine lyase/cysteine desulfurase
MHAPPGFGPRPVVTGWYAAFDDLAEAQGEVSYAPDARRFMGSTFDASGLYRFNAVRRMLAQNGLTTAAISAHTDRLKQRFIAADPLPGMTLISDPAARFLAWRGPNAAALHDALKLRGVITDVRGDVLRIGFGLYHDEGDVDRLLEEIGHCR